MDVDFEVQRLLGPMWVGGEVGSPGAHIQACGEPRFMDLQFLQNRSVIA